MPTWPLKYRRTASSRSSKEWWVVLPDTKIPPFRWDRILHNSFLHLKGSILFWRGAAFFVTADLSVRQPSLNRRTTDYIHHFGSDPSGLIVGWVIGAGARRRGSLQSYLTPGIPSRRLVPWQSGRDYRPRFAWRPPPLNFGQVVDRHVAEFGQLLLRHSSSVALRGDIFSEVVVHLIVSNPLVLPPE